MDVLLLDFQLLGMDTLELLNEIHQVRQLEFPVLISSGQGSEKIALRTITLGAADYVVKLPGYVQHLPFVIEGAFFRGQSQRESESGLRTIIEMEPECMNLISRQGEL